MVCVMCHVVRDYWEHLFIRFIGVILSYFCKILIN
jgi:hypothetical protein